MSARADSLARLLAGLEADTGISPTDAQAILGWGRREWRLAIREARRAGHPVVHSPWSGDGRVRLYHLARDEGDVARMLRHRCRYDSTAAASALGVVAGYVTAHGPTALTQLAQTQLAALEQTMAMVAVEAETLATSGALAPAVTT